MATRIENILADARITLADKDEQRWTDDDLLRLLNEAHKDFATETQLLAGRVELPVELNNPYFTLPDDIWLITRVLWGTELLPVISHTELDHRSTVRRFRDFDIGVSDTWETDTGLPEAFLYDRRNANEGKLYPIPDSSLESTEYNFIDRVDEPQFTQPLGVLADDTVSDTPYGVTVDAQDYFLSSSFGVAVDPPFTEVDVFVGNGALGVTTAIDDYTFNSAYGVVSDIYDPSIDREFINSPYGVLGSVSENEGVLYIYYVKCPVDLATTESTLETSPIWDKALKYYTIGHAFLNDLDTEYQAKGAQQLQLYERELLKAKKTESRDGTRASNFRTDYRRVI